MKGDFSRLAFDPAKHYTQVLHQQGRVQTDADWNEQAEAAAHHHRIVALDVIGPCGVPEHGGGFAVGGYADGEFTLSSGRLYVGGKLCELRGETTYLQQPFFPHPVPVSPAEGRVDLVYLDVWDRLITAVEAPEIREPALEGGDTAARVQTVWQVRVIVDVGTALCDQSVAGWPPPASEGRLAATVRGAVENQLYRVEIHDPGEMDVATFKWSRENGSVVFPVRELVASSDTGTAAIVDTVGRLDRPLPQPGDWVEVSGDESDLMGTPGTIARVESVEAERSLVGLDRDVTLHADEPHLKLRRWDQRGEAQAVTAGRLELEDGLEIEFSGPSFSVGDYWMFPVRTGRESVEWPPSAPRGIGHDYCKLALLSWKRDAAGRWDPAIADCRPRFAPLVSGAAAEACARAHEEVAQLRAMLAEQARALSELRARLSDR